MQLYGKEVSAEAEPFAKTFEMYKVLNEHYKSLGVNIDFGPDGNGGWWAGTTKDMSCHMSWPDKLGSVKIVHNGTYCEVESPEAAIEWARINLK